MDRHNLNNVVNNINGSAFGSNIIHHNITVFTNSQVNSNSKHHELNHKDVTKNGEANCVNSTGKQ